MKKSAKLIHLVHNPTAGEGEHTREKIVDLIEKHGYQCIYDSSKNGLLEHINPLTEFIAVAGGDGTIRKTIMCLLNKKLKFKRPIALLPFGTANNIATSLQIPQNNAKNISSWSDYNLKKFDVGQVVGMPDTAYFFEAFGFGLFPRLMKELKKMDTDHIKTPEQEFEFALKTLLHITRTYEPVQYELETTEGKIENKALMIEVLNISSVGPRLRLSTTADPGDGYFDVIIVNEDQRELLENYVLEKCALKDPEFPIKPVRAKDMKILWEGKDAHADDEVIKLKGDVSLNISVLDSLLEIVTATPTT